MILIELKDTKNYGNDRDDLVFYCSYVLRLNEKEMRDLGLGKHYIYVMMMPEEDGPYEDMYRCYFMHKTSEATRRQGPGFQTIDDEEWLDYFWDNFVRLSEDTPANE